MPESFEGDGRGRRADSRRPSNASPPPQNPVPQVAGNCPPGLGRRLIRGAQGYGGFIGGVIPWLGAEFTIPWETVRGLFVGTPPSGTGNVGILKPISQKEKACGGSSWLNLPLLPVSALCRLACRPRADQDHKFPTRVPAIRAVTREVTESDNAGGISCAVTCDKSPPYGDLPWV